MHRKARPWADADLAVVQVVDVFEQPGPVDQPVDPAKMERLPKPDKEEVGDKPQG